MQRNISAAEGFGIIYISFDSIRFDKHLHTKTKKKNVRRNIFTWASPIFYTFFRRARNDIFNPK